MLFFCFQNLFWRTDGCLELLFTSSIVGCQVSIKKILADTVPANTLETSVKTYNKFRVSDYMFIKHVQWASAHMDVFCIYEIFLKKFLPDPSIRIFPFGILNERENRNSAGSWQNGKEVNSYEEIFFP